MTKVIQPDRQALVIVAIHVSISLQPEVERSPKAHRLSNGSRASTSSSPDGSTTASPNGSMNGSPAAAMDEDREVDEEEQASGVCAIRQCPDRTIHASSLESWHGFCWWLCLPSFRSRSRFCSRYSIFTGDPRADQRNRRARGASSQPTPDDTV